MKFKLFLMSMVASLMFCAVTSCVEKEETFADDIKGAYTGPLTVGNEIIEDVYVVTVVPINSSSVTVFADFYSSGSENYNIEKINGIYYLSSKTSSNIDISVSGKTMSISFVNKAGTMTNYRGYRD